MAVLLALILSLALVACSAPPAAMNVQSTPPPVEIEVEEEALAPPEEEVIYYTVDTAVWEDSAQTEEGIPLATYRFVLPELTAVREDGSAITEAKTEKESHALTVADAFNEKFGKWAKAEEFSEIVSWAEEDFAWKTEEGIEWFGPYALELDCTVYQTEHLVSVSGLYYSNTGGAHPNVWQLGWNFDLEEGVFFTMDLLDDGAGLQAAVTEEIIRQANQPLEDGTVPVEWYWEDYTEIAANWSSYAVSFDESGMTVVFSPYELAPYAAGPQEFFVTYDWLRPYLGEHGCRLLGLAA